MKVFYFNDRSAAVFIRVQKWSLIMEESILEAHKGKEYDVHVPRGHTLFVKEWGNNMVLIASKEKDKP